MQNIKKGLEIMRVVSVKYSSPNSVSGRFPRITRAILSKNFPGFAYYAATAPNLNTDGSLGEIAAIDSENIKPFLRLFDTGYNVFFSLLLGIAFCVQWSIHESLVWRTESVWLSILQRWSWKIANIVEDNICFLNVPHLLQSRELLETEEWDFCNNTATDSNYAPFKQRCKETATLFVAW